MLGVGKSFEVQGDLLMEAPRVRTFVATKIGGGASHTDSRGMLNSSFVNPFYYVLYFIGYFLWAIASFSAL